jgi:hypothetical protein
MNPEENARQAIDAKLTMVGWIIQTKDTLNLSARRGVAVCELSFATGEPDYTLFVDGKALSVVEAKPVGHSLTGVMRRPIPARSKAVRRPDVSPTLLRWSALHWNNSLCWSRSLNLSPRASTNGL